MVRSTAWFAALLLGAGLLAPGMLHAQSKTARTVQDDAGLFSKEAITKANSDIARIKSKHGKDFFVETLKEGPATGQGAWARNRAKNASINGVYLVFTSEPKHFEVVVGNKTKEKMFTQTDSDELVDLLKTHMGKNRELLRGIFASASQVWAPQLPPPPPPPPPPLLASRPKRITATPTKLLSSAKVTLPPMEALATTPRGNMLWSRMVTLVRASTNLVISASVRSRLTPITSKPLS